MSSHEGPPGYDPPAATATATATATVADTKPKTKSVKRNERKKEKEKRIQGCNKMSLYVGILPQCLFRSPPKEWSSCKNSHSAIES
uniref:Uncharacterized protein n=1 Tax=Cannabis sativa TaxID=3483 RepID=A0A803QXY9_CANSA